MKKNKFDKLNIIYEVTQTEIEAKLLEQYKIALRSITNEMTALYDKVQAMSEDEILVSDLYQYKRCYSLFKQVNKELDKLCKSEVKILDAKLEEFAVTYSKGLIDEFNLNTKLDTKAAKMVVCKDWVGDGKNYSNRIWTNKTKLSNALEKGLFKIITIGGTTDALAKEISDIFNVNFKVCKRLVRTELSYLQNKLALDRYKDSGIKQYRYMTMRDDKVCEYCKALNNQIFNIDDAKIGINVPPTHPSCRCLIAPVVVLKKGQENV